MDEDISLSKLIAFNKNAITNGYKYVLSKYCVREAKSISKRFYWRITKVIPLHFNNGKEVKRYFRVFFKPHPNCLEDDILEGMTTDQLAALVGMQSFSIAIDEETYADNFGEFIEKDF
jgi:hypothetical protein